MPADSGPFGLTGRNLFRTASALDNPSDPRVPLYLYPRYRYLPADTKRMNEETRKKKIVTALRKAETGIGRIIAEVESDQSACFPIIQQTLAAIGLLKSANTLMLEGHMEREMEHHGAGSLASLRKEILKIVKTSQNK